ncbi:MAG TPA: Fe-S cluster assembly protein SufD [Thermoanaerobaculia bacterium]|nr:Fe-S cluster assembly protein SufD [Thermoanaerobaculia bacterium]
MEAVASSRESAIRDQVSAARSETRERDYLARFEAAAAGLPPMPAGAPSRRAAIDRFVELGFPTIREEGWRFTNLAEVARTEYRAAPPAAPAAEEVARHLLSGTRPVVLVNGRLAPALSRLDGAPFAVSSLATALRGEGPAAALVAATLGTEASVDQPFVALNTALFEDGVALEIPDGALVEEPIQVLHLTVPDAAGTPISVFPRSLVVAGRSSQATVVETYATLGEGAALVAPVTEVFCRDDAALRHYRVESESTATVHLGTLQVELERAASLLSLSLSYGGGLVRNDMGGAMRGEGSECTLDGLYFVTGRQHVDFHMRMDHVAAHCSSHELFKGILDGRSRAVFNGLIHVHPGAQKTDAKQTNRNLLLSPEAMVNSNPQLEIFADDVKCTHGSTIGQLDADAMFYMRSRGVDPEAAKSLLTWAFASELVERVHVPALREQLERLLIDRLPQGEIVRHVM